MQQLGLSLWSSCKWRPYNCQQTRQWFIVTIFHFYPFLTKRRHQQHWKDMTWATERWATRWCRWLTRDSAWFSQAASSSSGCCHCLHPSRCQLKLEPRDMPLGENVSEMVAGWQIALSVCSLRWGAHFPSMFLASAELEDTSSMFKQDLMIFNVSFL